jgi:hypothetical protein
MGQAMRFYNTIRFGLFGGALFFLASAALAQGLSMTGNGPFQVVEIHGAPDYRFTSDRGWSRIRASSTLPDSARVDIAMTESIVLKSARGETYVLQGVYDFPLSRLGMRRAILLRSPRVYGASTPVAVAGVRGAEGGAIASSDAVYRSPRELHDAFKAAVLSGKTAALPTFFTEDTIEDSEVADLIRTLSVLLASPDSQLMEWSQIASGYWTSVDLGRDRSAVAAWFEHWAESVESGNEERQYLYQLLPEANGDLGMLKGAASSADFFHLVTRADAIRYWWARREMKTRVITSIPVDSELIAAGMPANLLTGPLGNSLVMELDPDTRVIGVTYRLHNRGDSGFCPGFESLEPLSNRVRDELLGLERLIRDYRESTDGKLPPTLSDAARALRRDKTEPNPLEDVETVFQMTRGVIEHPDVLAFVDPWNNDYRYEIFGETYVLYSTSLPGETFALAGPMLPIRFSTLFDSLAGTPFSVRVENNDAPVFIAGGFNNWSKTPMRLDSATGKWAIRLSLRPGRWQYKFIQGDHWFPDPENPERVPDGFGGSNSVLEASE